MEKIIFTYRITSDTGFAPCVDDGLLTLACCKGGKKTYRCGLRNFIGCFFEKGLNKEAEVYVSGIYDNKLLYLAKITEVIEMKEYFSDKKYKKRLDQIYELKNGELKRKPNYLPNTHNDENANLCDINGKYVLISDKFVYLGEKALKIDNEILKYYPKGRGQFPIGQHKNSPAEVLSEQNIKNSNELYKKLEELITKEGYNLTEGKIKEPNTPIVDGGCRCSIKQSNDKKCGSCVKE